MQTFKVSIQYGKASVDGIRRQMLLGLNISTTMRVIGKIAGV